MNKLGFALSLALCILVAAAPADAALKVAILGTHSTTSADIQSKLQATGAFSTVDIIPCDTSTPTLATLKTYDAVLIYSGWAFFIDPATLGNNLADYVDAGGGVVQGMLDMYTAFQLTGRWLSGNYNCIVPATTYNSSSLSLATQPNEPQSPLLVGVTTLSSMSDQGLGSINTANGAVSVWDYTSGRSAICRASINGHARVDLNFIPDPSYYSGNGGPLMKNALQFVSGGAGPFVGAPSSVMFPDTGTGATAQAIQVTFTNVSMMSATANSVTIAGINGGDFSVTAPQTPITVGSMGSFNVLVSFAPSGMGTRTASLKVSVNGQTSTNDVSLSGNGIGPKLVITPSPLLLGSAQLGQTATKDLTVTNQGGNVTVTGATITVDAAEFALGAGPQYGVVLPMSGQFTQTIKFTPSVSGARTGEVTFTTNDVTNPTIKIPLQGTSGPPALTLDALTVIFPTVNVGATTSAQPVTVSNTGFSDLNVTAVTLGGTNAADFVLNPMTLPATIAPGGNAKFSVSFAPTATGSRSATVTVASNDPQNPTKVVNVAGMATKAVATVTPGSLAFGDNMAAKASAPQTVTISNSGTGTLQVKAFTFDGMNGTSFNQSTGMTPPFALTGGAMSAIGVVCNPKMVGALAGNLTVTTDVGDKLVTMTCNGIAPMVSVTPNKIDFGGVAVQGSSPPVAVKVSNSGTSTLTLSAFQITGSNFSDFTSADAPSPPTTIAAGSSLTFHVVFAPSLMAAETGEVDIGTDDPLMPAVKVTLTGMGAQLGVSSMPAMLDFGMVSIGATGGPKPVTISSTGGATLDVTKISVTGVGGGFFSVDQKGPLMIDGGKSVDVNVSFLPTLLALEQGTLDIEIMGLPPILVPVRGTGSSPTVNVAPLAIDFGPIHLGSTSTPQSVTIKNTGTVPLTIATVTPSSDAFTVDKSATMLTLMAGQTTTFAVAFAPTATGETTGSIGVSLMGLTVPAMTVMVKGAGVASATPKGGCSVALARELQAPSLMLLLVVVALLARRRRSATRG